MMTDPIADMLTRIRNAYHARKEAVEFPASKIKGDILRVLKSGGYIEDYEVLGEKPKLIIRVYLRYKKGKIPAVECVRRKSRPGRRVYVRKDEIVAPLNGFGMAVLSTSRGILSDREAREAGIGGELLLEVW